MFDVPHRHAVMTIPDRLRPVLKEDRNLWKVVMESAIKALNDILSYALRKEVLAGAIIVLHPFARDLCFNVPRCPKCGSRMEFVEFFKKDPPVIPEKREFCTKLDDWNYLISAKLI